MGNIILIIKGYRMKAKKKYELRNSYFKLARMYGLPNTMLEIAEYLKEHGELPFEYRGENWVYDAFCERQKYYAVLNSQYLTPDATVDQMLHFAGKYFNPLDNYVLEPCCGTGQITKELLKDGYNVTAFDADEEMVELCQIVCEGNTNLISLECSTFKDFDYSKKWDCYSRKHNQVIANPPYEVPILTEFFEWLNEIQDYGAISVLLLSKGFIDKDKPKALVKALRKFGVLEKEDMQEEFARTKSRAEIVVLKKL